MNAALRWAQSYSEGNCEGKVIPAQVITAAREWRILSKNPDFACSPTGKKA